MMTNTFRPYVGGVASSVQAFTDEFRRQGHRVLVVAPRYENARDDEPGLVRVPAIQKFNGSDMSVRMPVPGLLAAKITDFAPDVVHAHQPFLMGDTALRIAVGHNLPLVFTYHTMWELYSHYVPGDSPVVKRFIVALATGYSNLCDSVIAPSQSIRNLLVSRGVASPIATIPTGVDLDLLTKGAPAAFRRRTGIPDNAFVVGHVGRLAEEKNLPFLARAVAQFVRRHDTSCFVVVGEGPVLRKIEATFAEHRLQDRLFTIGRLEGKRLVDAYAAFDVFAFASKSETQGLVLIEAMAAGVPAVAIDARGVREVIENGKNGVLLDGENLHTFAAALHWIAAQTPRRSRQLSECARQTASRYALDICAAQTLQLYNSIIHIKSNKNAAGTLWENAMRRLNAEWKVWAARAKAGAEALAASPHR